MKHFIFIVLSVLLFQQATGQISGAVDDISGKPIPSVSISLLKVSDSLIITTVSTGEKGFFKIDHTGEGVYRLIVSSMGYQSLVSLTFEFTGTVHAKIFDVLILQAASKQLDEVIISADKPAVQQQTGGLTVNVQNSLITKGSSVLQLLQRSPGVAIDLHNNNITLNGKGGVMIMLDGKLMRMLMTGVMALLNGMNGGDIDKIELLVTPPARYDADGNAGLINIITKKNKRAGTDGSFTATAGSGKGEKGSANITINHNSKKTGLSGSYSYSHEKSYGELYAGGTESVAIIGGPTTFNYTGISNPISDYHNLRLGMDHQPDSTTRLGVNINYSIGDDRSNNHNHGNYQLRPDSNLLFNANITGVSHPYNLINSLYFEKKFSKSKINFDADYIYHKNSGVTNVESTFADNHGAPAGTNDSLYAPRQRNLVNTRIEVGVARLDYTTAINKKITLEAGMKGTYTRSNSASGIENLVNNQWVLSSVGVSNNLLTKEVIGAAYTSFIIKIDTASSLIAGFRYEYAHNSTAHASNQSYAIDRKTGKMFPAIFFSKKLTDLAMLQLSYTKRISRPSYSDLASYVTYNDPVSIFTGNPSLKPTVTDDIRFAYNYRNYIFSLLFSRDKDVILGTQISTGPSKGLVYLAPQNAPYQNNVTVQTSIPLTFNNWWQSNHTFTGSLRHYRIDYTPQAFEKTYVDYSVNFNEIFKVKKNITLEISGYYHSSSYYSTSKNKGNGMINAGIKKELNNNKGSLQLSASDILRSGRYYSYIGNLTRDAFDSQVYIRYIGESAVFPIIRLTYYRSFGLANSKSQRKDDASQEERRRL